MLAEIGSYEGEDYAQTIGTVQKEVLNYARENGWQSNRDVEAMITITMVVGGLPDHNPKASARQAVDDARKALHEIWHELNRSLKAA